MSEETAQMPPLAMIEAIDPYPFHGVAYYNGTPPFQRLDPRDGRAVIQLPTKPDRSQYFPSISPDRSGFLWDIGREDPPVTPLIEAAGGKSLGRRIIRSRAGDQRYPVRFGEKTRLLTIGLIGQFGQTYELRLINVDDGSVLASVPVAEFGLDMTTVVTYGGTWSPGQQVGYSPLVYDCSADGRRTLWGIVATHIHPNPRWDEFTCGVVESVLGLDEAGNLTATLSVLKTFPDCVGSFASTVESNVTDFNDGSDGGPPSCVITYSLAPIDTEFRRFGIGGRTLVELEWDGFIIGGIYTDTGIEYFRFRHYQRDEHIATASRAANHGTYNPDTESCEYTTQTPLSLGLERNVDYELSCTLGGATTSCAYSYQSVNSGTETREPPTAGDYSGTWADSLTVTGASTRERTGTNSLRYPSSKWIEHLPQFYDPSKVYSPPSITQWHGGNGDPAIGFSFGRSWALCFSVSEWDGVAESVHLGFAMPVLTPDGLKGSTRAARIYEQVSEYGVHKLKHSAAYSPLTRDAIRECDLPPDSTLLGFI